MFEDEVRRRVEDLAAHERAGKAAALERQEAREAAAKATWPRVEELAQEAVRVLSAGPAPRVAVAELRRRRRLELLGYGWELRMDPRWWAPAVLTQDGRLFLNPDSLGTLTAMDDKSVTAKSPFQRDNSRPGDVYRWAAARPGPVADTSVPILTREQWRSSPGSRPSGCVDPHQDKLHITAGDDGEPVLCYWTNPRGEAARAERRDLRAVMVDAAVRLLTPGGRD